MLVIKFNETAHDAGCVYFCECLAGESTAGDISILHSKYDFFIINTWIHFEIYL